MSFPYYLTQILFLQDLLMKEQVIEEAIYPRDSGARYY
jgi:hypothetical protein